MFRLSCLLLLLSAVAPAADLAGSKDPPGMKRYEGSEIIGYREARFDEYLLPLGVPTSPEPSWASTPRAWPLLKAKSSRYAYVAPGRPDRHRIAPQLQT